MPGCMIKKLRGIPSGFKRSANYIDNDIPFALDACAYYINLDGRGGGTDAAPEIFRNHISVPTILALARARRYLDEQGASGRVDGTHARHGAGLRA